MGCNWKSNGVKVNDHEDICENNRYGILHIL